MGRFAEAFAEFGRQLKPEVTPEDTLHAFSSALRTFGRPYGEEEKEITRRRGQSIIGRLLAGLPRSTRRTHFSNVAELVDEHNICPALIGLIGPAPSGAAAESCVVWPILLPLAPYADGVEPTEG